MQKKKNDKNAIPQMPEMPVPNIPPIPHSEYPSPLINKLCTFYNRYPDYETSIIDISVLARLAHTELNKFISRPHKKVTQIYFDKDPTEHWTV